MANTCTGDCLKCSFQQQTYCAAQRSYGIMKNQEVIIARLEAIEGKLATTENPVPMINLLEEPKEAQNGSGADNREPITE